MDTRKILPLLFLFVLILSGCGPSQISNNSLPTSRPASPSQGGPISHFPSPASSSSAPLPTTEDIVRTFFELINEKRIPEAVGMLSSTTAPDESTKQTWGVNFNTLDSISIKSIAEWQKPDWTENKMSYKVIVVAKVKPNPQFYAWDEGENTKWINLVKENNLWKISEIASGP